MCLVTLHPGDSLKQFQKLPVAGIPNGRPDLEGGIGLI
jgi:hypothetical protein